MSEDHGSDRQGQATEQVEQEDADARPARHEEVLEGTVVDPAPTQEGPPDEAEPAGMAQGADGLAVRRVTCPSCRRQRDISLAQVGSDDFCKTPLPDGSTCDYPLFFVMAARAEIHREDSIEPALGRHAGNLGRADAHAIRCPWPRCGEPNTASRTSCHRCRRPLHPPDWRPEPPQDAEPAVPVVPDTPPDPDPDTTPPWWVLALFLATFALLVAIVGYSALQAV